MLLILQLMERMGWDTWLSNPGSYVRWFWSTIQTSLLAHIEHIQLVTWQSYVILRRESRRWWAILTWIPTREWRALPGTIELAYGFLGLSFLVVSTLVHKLESEKMGKWYCFWVCYGSLRICLPAILRSKTGYTAHNARFCHRLTMGYCLPRSTVSYLSSIISAPFSGCLSSLPLAFSLKLSSFLRSLTYITT